MPRRTDPAEAEKVMLEAGLQPQEPYPGNNQPWRCVCLTCGRSVTPTRANVYSRGRGCKYCAANAPVDSDLARETMLGALLEPVEEYKTAHSPWKCRCMGCGAVVTPRLSNIQSGFGGCASCANGRSALARRGDPEKAEADMLAVLLRPLEPYPGVNKPWRCECLRCGNETRPRLGHIRQGIGGCRRCGRDKTTVKQLGDSVKAVSEMRAAGLEPLEPYRGYNKPWHAECLRCGDKVRPTLGSIRTGQLGCRQCGFASTAAKLREDPARAAADMEAAGYTPLEVYPGAAALPWRCIHRPCGGEITTRLSTIRQRGSSCAHCATYGFNTSTPAVVYVLHHPKHAVVKVGITAATSDRVARFTKKGFTTVGVLPFTTGQQARNVEQAVLRHLRTELGLNTALTEMDTQGVGGWTETFWADELPPENLWTLVQTTSEKKPNN